MANSLRFDIVLDSRQAREALAKLGDLTQPNEITRQAIHLGMGKLAQRAARERFSGKGPFPVAQNRLGNVSGRLKRAIDAKETEIVAGGYQSRLGAALEYFAAHEFGFRGTVQVPAHRRDAYKVNRKQQTRTSKKGTRFSIRANQFSVLPGSVRAHSKRLNIPARAPLRTALSQHAEKILTAEIKTALKRATL